MQTENDSTVAATNDTSVEVTPSTETLKTENMIPQSRLNEVIQQRKDKANKVKELEAKLAAFEKTATDAETEKLASQNEFQKLYEAEKVKNEASATALAEKEAAILALETSRINDMRDNKVLQLMSNAYNPQAALREFKAMNPDAMATLVTDGTFNQDPAEKLVKEFASKSENGYLFKSNSPGSLSNSGGKTPNPKGKQLEQAMADYQRRLKS